jgi:hypothetical protein
VAIEGESNEADLATLAAMIEADDVTAVIDRVYPLDKAPDPLRYVGDSHPKQGRREVGDERPEAHEPGGGRVTHAWLGAPDAVRPHRIPGGVARTVEWYAYFTLTGRATTAKL